MKMSEATQLGQRVSDLVAAGRMRQAHALLEPVLAARTRFPILGRIGGIVGEGPSQSADPFLERIAAAKTQGGWVVIGTALGARLDRDLNGALARCQAYIIDADVWYGADILGERVPGPALLLDVIATLKAMEPWRDHRNRWVRRTVGVAVHFWAKHSRGDAERRPDAAALLAFLEPLFSEWDLDAVKGVGWGLKTLGRYYPGLVGGWLAEQVSVQQRSHRALMVRKALTYLSPDLRERALGDAE
jgi:hypothetical protein